MDKRISIKVTITLMLAASALSCLFYGIFMGISINAYKSKYADLEEYAALLEKIDELYIGEYDKAVLLDTAMHATVDALGDRWSYYLSPEEYAEYLDYSNNRYAGIGVGVVIDEQTGGMCIEYVYKNSAADLAGIQIGDIITGIDGENIAGLTLDDMRTLLARPIGDSVELTVLRADGSTETLKAEYAYVFVDPVYFEMLDDGVGIIELYNFDEGAADSFISAAETLIEQGAAAIVFDVRGNGGGRVTELTWILDFLLPEGEIFVSVDYEGNEKVTMSDESMLDIPAVVLTDQNSFSAAEYFAATLSEYGYAKIVGEQTTGKNRSQITEPLPGGGALHISSGQYLTKNRVSLFDNGGLTPDYPVSLTDEQNALLLSGELDREDDTQLQKALELLGS